MKRTLGRRLISGRSSSGISLGWPGIAGTDIRRGRREHANSLASSHIPEFHPLRVRDGSSHG